MENKLTTMKLSIQNSHQLLIWQKIASEPDEMNYYLGIEKLFGD